MKMGQVSETVEVTGSAPVLQSQSAEVGTIIDSRTSDNLPLATRNYVQLTLLHAGWISVDAHSMNLGSNTAEEGGRPYINGNREQSNNFLLDGVDNNQASDNLLGFTPSPDAIAEVNHHYPERLRGIRQLQRWNRQCDNQIGHEPISWQRI